MNASFRLLSVLAFACMATLAAAAPYKETPWMEADVAAGRFPPVEIGRAHV
jgi:hypothetical protein